MTKKEGENWASLSKKNVKKKLNLSGHGYFPQYLLRKIRYKRQYYTIVIKSLLHIFLNLSPHHIKPLFSSSVLTLVYSTSIVLFSTYNKALGVTNVITKTCYLFSIFVPQCGIVIPCYPQGTGSRIPCE